MHTDTAKKPSTPPVVDMSHHDRRLHKSDPLRDVTNLQESLLPSLQLLHSLVNVHEGYKDKSSSNTKQTRSKRGQSSSSFPREQSDVRLFVANALRELVVPLGRLLSHRKQEVKVMCCAIILRITASSLIGSELLTESLLKDINKVVLQHPENELWQGVKSR